MNRRLMNVAALLLSAWFGSGCLADAQPENVDGVEAAPVDGSLASDATELDGSMSISDFIAHTKRAVAEDEQVLVGGRLADQPNVDMGSQWLGTNAGEVDDVGAMHKYVHGPDPQPWETLRKERNRLGPDPQPW